MCPSKIYIEVLRLIFANVNFLENRFFADVIKLTWGHNGLEWALIQYNWYPYKKRTHTHMHTHGRMPHEDGGQKWSAKSTSKETQDFWQPWTTERGMKQSPRVSRGNQCCCYLDFRLLACRTETLHFCCCKLLHLWSLVTTALGN